MTTSTGQRISPSANGRHDADKLQIAERLLTHFRGRADFVAHENAEGFYPVQLRSPLSSAAMNAHLSGRGGLGFYVLTDESKCFCSCVDFDDKPDHPNPEWMDQAERTFLFLQNIGLHPLMEISSSGKGAHVWLFLQEATDGWVVRAFWRMMVETGTKLAFKEIYPKQDQLSDGGIGNLVRYPLWKNSRFADPENEWTTIDPLVAMDGIRTTTAAELRELAGRQGIELRKPEPSPRQDTNPQEGKGRPGDDFNASASWDDAVGDSGWRRAGTSGPVEYWTRPGKNGGVSATTGFCKGKNGQDLFYCFSTNAEPLKSDKPYSRFGLYAALQHNGDYSVAARALRKKGYGAQNGEAKGNDRHQASATARSTTGTQEHAKATEEIGLIPISQVEEKSVVWLWEKWLAAGMITLLDGDPGLGKSFCTLDIAARVSRGWLMPPDSGESDLGPLPGSVLVINAEDDAARTIRPRLRALEADLDRVFLMPDIPDGKGSRPVVLPDDLELIERMVVQHKVKLVIVDPLMAFLTAKADVNKDSDIRRVLHKVKLMAEHTQAAFLVVRHLNKMTTVGEPLYRGGGSIGIIGAARSALMVGKDPSDPNRRILCRTKGNLAAEPTPLAFKIVAEGSKVTMCWCGEAEGVTAEDLLTKGLGRGGTPGETLEEAVVFLAIELAKGPRMATELFAEGEKLGLRERTIERAKKKLKVKSVKAGLNRGWLWELPDRTTNAPPN